MIVLNPESSKKFLILLTGEEFWWVLHINPVSKYGYTGYWRLESNWAKEWLEDKSWVKVE